MPRTPPSGADAALIAALAERGVSVSVFQLERWRARGDLPRNPRRSLGRGRGTRAELTTEVLNAAERLGRMARQGRRNPAAHPLLRALADDSPGAVRLREVLIDQLEAFGRQLGASLGDSQHADHTDDGDAGWQTRYDIANAAARRGLVSGHEALRELAEEAGHCVDPIADGPSLAHPSLLHLSLRMFSGGLDEVDPDSLIDAIGLMLNLAPDEVQTFRAAVIRGQLEGDEWARNVPVADVRALTRAVREADTEVLQRTAVVVTTAASYQGLAFLGSVIGMFEPDVPLAIGFDRMQEMLSHPMWEAWGQYQMPNTRLDGLAFTIAHALTQPGLVDQLEDYQDLLRGLLGFDELQAGVNA